MPNDHQADVDQVIRDLIDENPDLPIRADFYRGVNPHRYSSPFADPILRELVATPGCPQEWFVRILPGAFEVCVSAAGRLFLGVTDVVGEVAVVQLPQTSPGVVDVEAVQGSRFHVELLAAIRENAAVVEQMRAAVAS
jgi:hypothetical protein